MRVVVTSCYNYRDTWNPFLELFRKFYGGELYLLTDQTDYRNWPKGVHVAIIPGNWGSMLAEFARTSKEPLVMFLDDFFLNSPVQHHLIDEGLNQMKQEGAGCVRLYPCPGSDEDYGHPLYGKVAKGQSYRISTMPAIWNPGYLAKIAELAPTAWDFEIDGSVRSNDLPEPVLAFKRDVQPWPLEFLCTGITRGKWNKDALELFKKHDIQVDMSLRESWA